MSTLPSDVDTVSMNENQIEQLIAPRDIDEDLKMASEEELDNTAIKEFQEEKDEDSSSAGEDSAEVMSLKSNDISNEDQNDYHVKMPLLKYSRINGSLPRVPASSQETSNTSTSPLSIPCKCSTLGRVVIQPARSIDSTGLGMSAFAEQQSASAALSQSKVQTYSVLALAFDDASIQLLDAKTGEILCPSDQLKVKTDGNVVALSFDSGSKYLAALTDDGHVSIFELKYGVGVSAIGRITGNSEMGSERSQVQQQSRPEKKLFDSFLSRIAGDSKAGNVGSEHSIPNIQMTGSNISSSSARDTSEGQDEIFSNCKTASVLSTARFIYTSTNKTEKATCLMIDPAYHRKREKGILVGFDNGRLVYTKRSGHGGTTVSDLGFGGVMGNLLQPKRHDLDIYQSAERNGIEAVAWRGSLIAWADER